MKTFKEVKFEELKDIVKVMKEKAKGNDASITMIECFDNKIDGCRYFLAEDDNRNYGMMSLSAPPKIKEGEKSNLPDLIGKGIWVEGLVADSKSGLGEYLLLAAEEFATKQGKSILALAAYEYDQDPQPNIEFKINKPYSVAAYYADKRGFSFSGEAYIEINNNQKLYYPIYIKEVRIKSKL